MANVSGYAATREGVETKRRLLVEAASAARMKEAAAEMHSAAVIMKGIAAEKAPGGKDVE